MVRAPYFDKDGLKKGAWTREEDEKLRAYITRYGAWNWRKLPKFAGLSRCGKSCRLRWMNYLRPHLKHGNYTKEEEDLIIKLHEELGNKWSEIAAKLPGRTDNEVKNHWHTRLKKRVLEQDQNKSDDEMNEQSNGEAASQADVSQREVMEVEAQSGLAASCEETSQDGFHLFISDTAADQQVMESAGNKWNGEGCSNMASFGECSDDFWTAPFVPDNSFYNQDYYPSFSQEGCLVLSYDSYLDESLDLFYQVMKDFQGSNGS